MESMSCRHRGVRGERSIHAIPCIHAVPLPLCTQHLLRVLDVDSCIFVAGLHSLSRKTQAALQALMS